MKKHLGLVLVTFALGCGNNSGSLPFDDVEAPIIGGTVDNGDPAIGMMEAQDGNTGWWCTGTLISPTVFLTAGHCVEDASSATKFKVFFGTDQSKAKSTDWAPVKSFAHHPNYNSSTLSNGYDCAVLVLQNASSTPPIPYSHTPVDNSFINQPVRIVGYGNDNGSAGTGAGTKRQVSTIFDSYTSGIITVGQPGKTTCQGDSGGPTLYQINGVETVIGITSYGAAGCGTASDKTRVDKCAAWIDGYAGTNCTPSCAGRACGSDGCGGSCGACGTGRTCSAAGQCEATTCVPACTGKSCGDDGCGGSCGICNRGEICGAIGRCAPDTTTPTCSAGGFETEPNDAWSQASSTCANSYLYGTINHAGDIDWFSWSIAPNSTYTLTLGTLPANYNMVLYKSTDGGKTFSQVGTADDDGSLSDRVFARQTATGGMYWLGVWSPTGASNASYAYRLSVDVTQP